MQLEKQKRPPTFLVQVNDYNLRLIAQSNKIQKRG